MSYTLPLDSTALVVVNFSTLKPDLMLNLYITDLRLGKKIDSEYPGHNRSFFYNFHDHV